VAGYMDGTLILFALIFTRQQVKNTKCKLKT